jgi:hypothetical protein
MNKTRSQDNSSSLKPTFTPSFAQAIAKDLTDDAFRRTRDPRSDEYKKGFFAGAFNRLMSMEYHTQSIQPTDPLGSCQLDAWLSGYDEGKLAATAFQLFYQEGSMPLEVIPV